MSSNDFSNLIPIGTRLAPARLKEHRVSLRVRVAGHAVTDAGRQAYVLEYGSGSSTTIRVQPVKYVHVAYEPLAVWGEDS